VGLTRAKRNLYLVQNMPNQNASISLALDMHDVWLDYFKNNKSSVLRLQSGDNLLYKDGFLTDEQGYYIIAFSNTGKEKLKTWFDMGYEVDSAKVSYILAWRPQDSNTDYAVCLVNITLSKTGDDSARDATTEQ